MFFCCFLFALTFFPISRLLFVFYPLLLFRSSVSSFLFAIDRYYSWIWVKLIWMETGSLSVSTRHSIAVCQLWKTNAQHELVPFEINSLTTLVSEICGCFLFCDSWFSVFPIRLWYERWFILVIIVFGLHTTIVSHVSARARNFELNNNKVASQDSIRTKCVVCVIHWYHNSAVTRSKRFQLRWVQCLVRSSKVWMAWRTWLRRIWSECSFFEDFTIRIEN